MASAPNRIVEMIKSAPGKIDIPYFQKMQGDDYDASAEIYVPLLLQMDPQFPEPNEAIAFDLLKDWDYQAKSNSLRRQPMKVLASAIEKYLRR